MNLGLGKFLNDAEKSFKRDVLREAQESAEVGADLVRYLIRTTPSGLSPGKQNRIWTGHMLERVDTQVFKRGETITIRAGWQNVSSKEKYFKAQDLGTNGVAFGMHAITSAQKTIERELKNRGVI